MVNKTGYQQPDLLDSSNNNNRSSSPFHFHVRRKVTIFAVLAIVAVVVRLPWFFKDVVDWDESVFILHGQAILDGHLPYTIVWDTKPPLGLAFFSIVLMFLPHSIISIRLVAALLVAISAFLVFQISEKFVSARHAMAGAVLFIAAASLFLSGGQALMMEHIAIVPLLGALLIAIDDRRTSLSYFLIGVLLSVAVLTRTNLAYVAIAATVAVPLLGGRKAKIIAISGLYIVTGGLLVLFLVLLPFILARRGELFYVAAVKAPLVYATSRLGYSDTAASMLAAIVEPSTLVRYPVSILFWIGGAAGLVGLSVKHFFDAYNLEHVRPLILIVVFALAVLLSILGGGHPYHHYLIQAAPFFAIGFAAASSFLSASVFNSAPVFNLTNLVMILGALSGAQLLPAYAHLLAKVTLGAPLYDGQLYKLADYLRTTGRPADTYFFADDSLPYWLLRTYPVLPIAAFPANLGNMAYVRTLYGSSASTEMLLQDVIDLRPTRVVMTPHQFELGFGAIKSFHRSLADKYYFDRRIVGFLVFHVKPDAPAATKRASSELRR